MFQGSNPAAATFWENTVPLSYWNKSLCFEKIDITQKNYKGSYFVGAMTISITTFSIMTLSM
jgi:hypothetical protein